MALARHLKRAALLFAVVRLGRRPRFVPRIDVPHSDNDLGAGGAFDKYDAAALVGSTAFALPGILAANPNAATVFIIPRRSSSSSYVQAMQCRRLQRAVVVAAGSSREKTTMRIVDLNAASDAKAFRSSSFWKHLL